MVSPARITRTAHTLTLRHLNVDDRRRDGLDDPGKPFGKKRRNRRGVADSCRRWSHE